FPQDSQGRYRVNPGDFIVFDSTQKNAEGEECQWINDPVWTVDDAPNAADRKPSSNPFLLRIDVVRTGQFTVTASLEGITAPTSPSAPALSVRTRRTASSGWHRSRGSPKRPPPAGALRRRRSWTGRCGPPATGCLMRRRPSWRP